MEIHFVHSNENGDFLVVAVFVEKSNVINPSLAILEHFIPKEVDTEIVEHSRMDLNLILPSTKNFIHYEGSLTTPPCSEGVKWILLEDPIQAAEWQLEMIHEIIKEDNRPIQKTGDRHVYLSTGTGF